MYTFFPVVTDSILLLSQCYISLYLTSNSGQKSSISGHKRKIYISLRTCSHKRWTGPRVAKCNDCLKIMQRNSADFFLFFQNNYIFSIQRQILIPSCYIQCIQKPFHSFSSSAIILSIYPETDFFLFKAGIQISFNEQALHFLLVFTFGV